MRLIAMGTGPFVVPTLDALRESRHTLLAVVTKPVATVHTHKRSREQWPVRDFALAHSFPILDPENVNTPEARNQLADLQPDLLVVADYGRILKAETLAVARLGGINLHGSLLPKYRGAAPINWALYHGETESGVTVIHMTPALDAGPSIAQASTPIQPDETAPELEARLRELGAPLVLQAIDLLESGTASPIPQDPALATKAPRLQKSDGLVDWHRPAAATCNQIRALEPWPKTYTFLHREGSEPLRLILGAAQVCDVPPDAVPGTAVIVERDRLVIATGAGGLSPSGLQPSGKRMLSVSEFLNGYPVAVGDVFGDV